MKEQITESNVNIVSEKTKIEGNVFFDRITRVHGTLMGTVRSALGSSLILSETSLVEGNIIADQLIIEGYVRGDIKATGKVTITRTGRVIGNVHSPILKIEPGAYFQGESKMQEISH